MRTTLLLLLCLTGHVIAKEPPEVDCVVIHLTAVHCSWNGQGTPKVNYTLLYNWSNEATRECDTYLSENNTITGCKLFIEKQDKRFSKFTTLLKHNNSNRTQIHELKQKVKLNPPTNLTVKNVSDSNLWFYWNQTASSCVESEVRFRSNNKKWQYTKISNGRQNYCINLPSRNSRYELQVKSRIGDTCGESIYWSDWSEPVAWGSNNGTETDQLNSTMSVWTTVVSILAALTLVLLVMMLLHHERLRIIFIPVVPKPSLIRDNIEDWLQMSKGFKEGFKASYNERACPVREYCHVSQSNSESSDSSTSSVTTDQTDCSVFILADESEESTPCSSSTSTALASSEEQQVSV